MRGFKRLAIVVAIAAMTLPALEARTRKGDGFMEQGEKAQLAGDWDKALDFFEQAQTEDPSDVSYQMAVQRARFEASQIHIDAGQAKIDAGQLEEALTEFQRAFAIDPSSEIAEQELVRTYRLIRERERTGDTGPPLTEEEKADADAEARMERLKAVPVLKPISPIPATLRINNQPVRVLYETVAKLAGINVVIDPDMTANRNYNVDLTNSSLTEALDYLAVLTRTYWKPLTENTIFVTEDNVTKRRDYEDVIVKTFYLKNVDNVQELQEIQTLVRSITDLRRMFPYNSQYAIVVRGWKDQVDLAEKIIHDLDKPKAEVVVDVVVMEASRTRTRDIAASILAPSGSSGISVPIGFTGGVAPSTGDGTGGGSAAATAGTIALNQLGRLSSGDWSIQMPGGVFQALMTDRRTRILQRPQLRVSSGQQGTLNLGEKVPIATGSFQPGVGSVGVSPLVSTQFQYQNVGVNVDISPTVQGEDEISMHLDLELSTVRERIDVGGIQQPIIGTRHVVQDVRLKSGEVTLLGGLEQNQVTDSTDGVPGLGQIPLLKWLGFSSDSKENSDSEVLIALVPRIVRRPDITELNLRGISAGNDQVVKLNYAPSEEDMQAGEAATGEETSTESGVSESTTPGTPSEAAGESAEPAAEPAAETPQTPAAPISFQFDPPAVTTSQGATFTVSVAVQNATDLFNAPMQFQFDPQMVRLTEIARGPFLAGDGQQVIFTRNILNDSGSASIVLNRLPGSTGITGSGTLVTLTFQVVGSAGSTELRIPNLTLRDSQMQQIDAVAPVLPIQIQ